MEEKSKNLDKKASRTPCAGRGDKRKTAKMKRETRATSQAGYADGMGTD